MKIRSENDPRFNNSQIYDCSEIEWICGSPKIGQGFVNDRLFKNIVSLIYN